MGSFWQGKVLANMLFKTIELSLPGIEPGTLSV